MVKHLDYTLQDNWRQTADEPLQSPINIDRQRVTVQHAVAIDMTFSGQTKYDDREVGEQFLATGELYLGEDIWSLERIHFHDGAEHLIDGYRYDAEVHFVYRKNEQVTVVAVFIQANEICDTATIQEMYNGSMMAQQLVTLLPEQKAHYRYKGSLTTPPLSQSVQWLVMCEPITISTAELTLLHEKYPDNHRDIQDISGRVVELFKN